MNKAISICILIVMGLLSLCALPGAAVSAQSADPTMRGPLTVMSDEYYRPDLAFTPTGLTDPVELSGVVHYPTNWMGGPLPLIIFIHGAHKICSQNGTPNKDHWPCRMGEQVIPNYRGYDYIAEVLASNGYIVVSINANGIIPQEGDNNKNLGGPARAELIHKHLDLWKTFNTASETPFFTKFNGKIDMQRIGTMGHSKGGEGVIQYVTKPLPESFSAKYDLKAVFALATTDGDHLKINNVPFAVLLPYCDGDVSDLKGVHIYDDSRYNMSGEEVKDIAPKHTILVMGANHNFFNRVWTPMQPPEITYPDASDDFTIADPFCGPDGSGRLTSADQRTTAIAYICAFMRAYVGGESQFLPLLTAQAPAPPSVGANKVYVSFHPPDNFFSRLDVNRFSEDDNDSMNTLGDEVIPTALHPYNLCGGTPGARCINSNLPLEKEPHAVDADKGGIGLKQLKLGWSSKFGSLTNKIPIMRSNVSGYQALQFRASVRFDDMGMLNPPSVAQNFRVILKDGTGATASVRVADFSSALFYPPGGSAKLPKAVLNTVRLPLSAFTRVNLTDIRSVEFRFDQPSQGSLLITDIAFASTAHILLPVFSTDACLKDDSSGAELRFNTATGNYVFCCAGGMTTSGVGKVVTQGNVVSLVQGSNEADRRLVATLDRSTKRGTASLQSPAGSLICSITDRNTANNTCSCAPAP